VSKQGLNRRQALSGAAAAGIGVPLLAACGSDTGEAVDTKPKAESGQLLASTDDVEVGSCVVFPKEQVVLAQPAEGTFTCFSAVCTHQGCLVSTSSSGEIPCTCHGSYFSLEDGSVLKGPATKALSKVEIEVDGDRITVV